MTARDYLTILKVVWPYEGIMAKRLVSNGRGGIRKVTAVEGSRFDGDLAEIDSIHDLAEILTPLEKCEKRLVIRGKPVSTMRNVARRIHPPHAAFCEDPTGHHWILIDFDEIACPYFIDPSDRYIAIGYLVRLLPREFWKATYYYHWSSGAGLDGWQTLRCHIWFWLTKPVSDRAAENWAKWVNHAAGERIIDACVYRTVQPHFTANPLIEDVTDPVEQRSGLVQGAVDTVDLDLPTLNFDDERRRREAADYQELVDWGLREPRQTFLGADDTFYEALERIGDGVGRDGFHIPITRALACWAAHHDEDDDATVKEVIRAVAREAPMTAERDLEGDYLSDKKLDASLRGAHEKFGT